MGEKSLDFKTPLRVKECGARFQSAIVNGRGTSARIGGLTARLLGGESLTWYTPEDNSPFARLNDDPPAFSVGVAVPKAQGAHQHGTQLNMYVWDRGDYREVAILVYWMITVLPPSWPPSAASPGAPSIDTSQRPARADQRKVNVVAG